MSGIYTTARLGLAGRVTDDVRAVLDRDPVDFRTFVEDHASEFAVENLASQPASGTEGDLPSVQQEVTHADWTASNFDSGPPLLLDGECGRHVRTVREGVDEAPVEVGGRPVGLDHHRPVVDVVARPADETPVAVER